MTTGQHSYKKRITGTYLSDILELIMFFLQGNTPSNSAWRPRSMHPPTADVYTSCTIVLRRCLTED